LCATPRLVLHTRDLPRAYHFASEPFSTCLEGSAALGGTVSSRTSIVRSVGEAAFFSRRPTGHLESGVVSRRLALLALVAAFAAIYLPDLGHGFVRDDFEWIESSRIASPVDVVRILTQQPGFYRPLVSLTFSVDHAIWGLDPHGYAATNVALFSLAAVLIYRLARTLELPPAAAVLAAALWAFDIHAPRMALLWISGRTALLLCIFALATADAVLRKRYKTAGIWCLLALLSKEEAALLPAMLTVFVW
jgi:hypothetical protein